MMAIRDVSTKKWENILYLGYYYIFRPFFFLLPSIGDYAAVGGELPLV